MDAEWDTVDPNRMVEDSDDPLHNDYYVGVLQLRQSDVPELGFYPGSDLFQLLWCPRSHPEEYAPYCRVYWRRVADVTAPLRAAPTPRVPDSDLVPKVCRFSPERVTEYPHIEELPDDLRERISMREETPEADGYSYQSDLSVAFGTKVGGHVRWNQPPPAPLCPICAREMDHLLSVASGEWSDSMGRGRWQPEEERHLSFDDVSDREEWRATSNPSVMIGDMADLTVFICRHHSDWPISWVHQA